ncbi:MAG: hypothetical protein Q7K13_05275 [Polynucleobacter sp.]|uniref:spermine/spermidine synthase domain-containing protein n=1 Tax=Polynucleobacter sp. TaxID=2029855 RepID=UPI00272799EC|nr:hypothetical protein [Polynucleobacter sp.]MDO8713874.1 hypothetical protein [Polynucleobacter sp.]
MPDFYESLRKITSQERDIQAFQNQMPHESTVELRRLHEKTMMGFLLAIPHPKHILMIGLRGGSLADFCYANLPQCQITIVNESCDKCMIDKTIQTTKCDARINQISADGADFVRDAKPEFDVILIDNCDFETQSAQLCTKEFYENCCRILSLKGILVVNFDCEHPAYAVFIERINQTYKGNFVEISVVGKPNYIVMARKDIPISARGMSLSWTLGHHASTTRAHLKNELQRILHYLDSLEPYGQGTHDIPDTTSLSNQNIHFL